MLTSRKFNFTMIEKKFVTIVISFPFENIKAEKLYPVRTQMTVELLQNLLSVMEKDNIQKISKDKSVIRFVKD